MSLCTGRLATARSLLRRQNTSPGGISVVSVDLRGHGESDKPSGPYPIAAYADDIAYNIEQVGLSKVVAVGHSMGGVIVLQFAAAHPGSVAAIVMVDPPLVFLPERRAVMEAMVSSNRGRR